MEKNEYGAAMNVSELIEKLEDFLEEEGDMEIFLYDSSGDLMESCHVGTGCIMRGNGTEEYAVLREGN